MIKEMKFPMRKKLSALLAAALAVSMLTLPAGAVISAEPGIYLPGKFGVRIEDTTFVRPDGCEIVGKSPKELIVL